MTKFKIVGVFTVLISIFIYRLLSIPSAATFLYIIVSYFRNYDSNIIPDNNHDGQVEDVIFTHRFVKLNETFQGFKVNVTYHAVECGLSTAEPIVFGHGLCENWRVWKNIMKEFCATNRVIAYDSEGSGQSFWPDVLADLPKGSSREFMADMQMAMLRALGVTRFNLVVTDYSFWSTLSILGYKDPSTQKSVVLRYGKLQSTVGVEDASRVPQGKLMKLMPTVMDFIVNLNSHALSRVIFGKSLMKGWAAVESSKRNYQAISDEAYDAIVAPGLHKGGLTAWVYFYSFGKDICSQMEQQRRLLGALTCPVYIVQGAKDIGQPMYLFDGTMSMSIVDRNTPLSLLDRLVNANTTHMTINSYSSDGLSKVGPTAGDFFTSSSWVRFKTLPNVGHFIHMEGEAQVLEALKELMNVPIE